MSEADLAIWTQVFSGIIWSLGGLMIIVGGILIALVATDYTGWRLEVQFLLGLALIVGGVFCVVHGSCLLHQARSLHFLNTHYTTTTQEQF